MGKEYVKVVHCHPAYLNFMQSTSQETLDWRKRKLETRSLRELSITSDTTVMAESEEELKSLLMKMKEESERSWLKAQHSEN